MSEATTEASDGQTANENGSGEVSKKAKKPRTMKPLYVFVPTNIEDVAAVDPAIPEPPEEDEDGKRPDVEITTMPEPYLCYVVPGGPGRSKAVNAILAKHNVDLRNVERVRMFAGEKTFDIQPQYNIRFK